MKNKLRHFTAVLLSVLLLVTGCNPAGYEVAEPAYTIGVVLKSQESEHWIRIRAGMEQAAEEENVRLLITWASDESALAEQKDMIADLLRCKIDALVVAPCDSWDCAWFRDACADKGIPVFTTDTAALDCEIPYIGSNQEWIGQTAANYLIQTLPQGSRVGVVSGLQRQQSLAVRTAAFSEAIDACGGLELAGVRDGCRDFASAVEGARALLEENVDALFCTSAVIGLAAAATVRENGEEVRVVAVDTQTDALEAVRTGAFDALITQSGDEIGSRTIETVLAALRGEEVSAETYIGGELLAADNIEEYLQRQNAEEKAWSVS